MSPERIAERFYSRDLSWMQFNDRVLDQVRKTNRTLLERLKFLAITASNLDEFLMVRVGSLYNYIDLGRERYDNSGLREIPFKERLLGEVKDFMAEQDEIFTKDLLPKFSDEGFELLRWADMRETERRETTAYFKRMVFPMLTPMLFDPFHPFPVLVDRVISFGVSTAVPGDDEERISFVQVPRNLPKFYELKRRGKLVFVPIEEIIRENLSQLHKNVEIRSISMFRLTRNGDFDFEGRYDDEEDFDVVEELQRKLKGRKTGRVVRLEVEPGFRPELLEELVERYEIDEDNVVEVRGLFDYSRLWQIVGHKLLRAHLPKMPRPVRPLSLKKAGEEPMLELLRHQDVLLQHPYNSMEPVVQLIKEAAEDPSVLAIKITIYRLATDSSISEALLRAAENGKHVSVLFEVKARFDEENNLNEARRLQRAGCFVIYGVGDVKTHTKLMLIVRKVGSKVVQYAHMASGNYNEDTAKIYSDIAFLTSRKEYTDDVSEFFNVITGHSMPGRYKRLITTPGDMRWSLIQLIRKEAAAARKGKPCGIVLKVNSLEDKPTIEELYRASKAGVPIKLIVRGICCLKPGIKKLSETIEVRSIVGDYLEHARIFYFHNEGKPKVFGGSADIMARSFDRRIESLFLVDDPSIQQMLMTILDYNLRDDVNTYELRSDGEYHRVKTGKSPFNLHEESYKVKEKALKKVALF